MDTGVNSPGLTQGQWALSVLLLADPPSSWALRPQLAEGRWPAGLPKGCSCSGAVKGWWSGCLAGGAAWGCLPT